MQAVMYLTISCWLCRSSAAEALQSEKQCYLHFLRSPVAIVADEQGERVAGVRLELNELQVGHHVAAECCDFSYVRM